VGWVSAALTTLVAFLLAIICGPNGPGHVLVLTTHSRHEFFPEVLRGHLFTLVAFSGGLWTKLSLRQTGAAFWFTILIPGLLLNNGLTAEGSSVQSRPESGPLALAAIRSPV
jgi:hypothetical protein